LDDLDAVPWRTLRHATGDAIEVPQLIRALASSHRAERQTALKGLFSCLLHQGTVNETTSRAIPFLFQLLAEETTPDRGWIAFLLASIAEAGSSLPIHGSADEQRYRELFAQRGTTLEAELEQEGRVLRAVQAEIGRRALSLVPFLGDSQSEIRATVARALGLQTAHAAALIPELTAAWARETAPDAQEAMRQSLEQLRAASR